VGLNSAINTLGLWTDSSFADWQILQRGSDYFDLRVVFKNLPLSQIWKIKIENEQEVIWQIDMEPEETLHIDEARIVCLISPHHKTWINDYRQGDFPRIGSTWREIPLNDIRGSLVGARFPKEGMPLPALTLELQGPQVSNVSPLIQSSPFEINAHVIGFKRVDSEEKRDYRPGYYSLFSVKIGLFNNDYFLDRRIEGLRQDLLQTTIKNKVSRRRSKQNLSVLLVNLPWQKDGKWGVRAGSRWPHIKDKSEGKYLPFPFFLAYSVSLLQRYNIKAHIIDAVAEEWKRFQLWILII
jgi:hypothetical protein